MDRGAWWTLVCGVAKELDTHTHKRIGHNLVTKQQEGFFNSGLYGTTIEFVGTHLLTQTNDFQQFLGEE